MTNPPSTQTIRRPSALWSEAAPRSRGATAIAYPAIEPFAEPTRTYEPSRLELVAPVAATRARPKALYAVIVVALVFAIMVAQLLLSIIISQGSYQLSSLQVTQTRLQRSVQAASQELNTLRSPQHLAANAQALGMSYNNDPLYLRLSDGAVLGTPETSPSSTGGFLGSPVDLVPNSTLSGVPLALPKSTTISPTDPVNSPQKGESSESAASTSVPLGTNLPTPQTH